MTFVAVSSSYALDREMGKGLTEDQVIRLAYIDALSSFGLRVALGEVPLPTVAHFEVKKERWDLQVVIRAEREDGREDQTLYHGR